MYFCYRGLKKLDEEDFGEKEKINKRKMFILEGIVSGFVELLF